MRAGHRDPNHHCCCCRARQDVSAASDCNVKCGDPPAKAPDFIAKNFFSTAVSVGSCAERGRDHDVEESKTKRKKCSDQGMDSIFESELKKLKDEPPESQHGPESQPTPFIYEPPVVQQQVVSDTLPTPPIETPTPLPESFVKVPVLSVQETITTPWCTQTTPKVDATDWLFISDPTPVPIKDDDGNDAVVPELSQPTPVPAAGTKPQSASESSMVEEKEDGFADTAVDKVEPEDANEANAAKAVALSVPQAAPDSVFPTVSLDVVTDLGRGKPMPPVPVMPAQKPTETQKTPVAAKKHELNFATLLLQRARAASASRQGSNGAELQNEPKIDFVTQKSSNPSKLKAFLSERKDQNPESAHPPASQAPEDVHPPHIARATI